MSKGCKKSKGLHKKKKKINIDKTKSGNSKIDVLLCLTWVCILKPRFN